LNDSSLIVYFVEERQAATSAGWFGVSHSHGLSQQLWSAGFFCGYGTGYQTF